MITHFRLGVSACLALACGSTKSQERDSSNIPPAACRLRLAPASAHAAATSLGTSSAESTATAVTPTSRIVVQSQLQLATVQRELESRIGRQLAAERGIDAGVLGVVNYTLERGPLVPSIEENSIVVQTEVQARAEVCRGRCYARCAPTALVRARIPLILRSDYRFGPSRVTASFTRGCKIQTLGGFLTVDVTRTLENQLKPQLERVQRQIDRELPVLDKQAAALWSELSKARSLPLGGCVKVHPQALVQGPVIGNRDTVVLRFALLAAPEFQTNCEKVDSMLPLPALIEDQNLPAEDDVTLGLVMPLEQIAAALGRVQRLDLGKGRARVLRATVTAEGQRVASHITLGGEVCGDVDIHAGLGFNPDGRSLKLVATTLSKDTAERLMAVGVESRTLASEVSRATSIPLPVGVEQSAALAPLLAKSSSNPHADVNARVSGAQAAGAAARAQDFVAWLKLRGRLEINPKLPVIVNNP